MENSPRASYRFGVGQVSMEARLLVEAVSLDPLLSPTDRGYLDMVVSGLAWHAHPDRGAFHRSWRAGSLSFSPDLPPNADVRHGRHHGAIAAVRVLGEAGREAREARREFLASRLDLVHATVARRPVEETAAQVVELETFGIWNVEQSAERRFALRGTLEGPVDVVTSLRGELRRLEGPVEVMGVRLPNGLIAVADVRVPGSEWALTERQARRETEVPPLRIPARALER